MNFSLKVSVFYMSYHLSPQGGIAFVLIKGILKVYFKQQQYIMQANRHILNYPESHKNRLGGEGDDNTEDGRNE